MDDLGFLVSGSFSPNLICQELGAAAADSRHSSVDGVDPDDVDTGYAYDELGASSSRDQRSYQEEHLHDMSVLNMVWAVAHLEPGSGRLTFSYPDREEGLQVRKRYVFFDTVTLERAGIACHNVDGVQSLVSLLVRIRGLPELARKEIRSGKQF